VRKGRRYGRKLVDRGADRAWGAARRRDCDGGDVLPHSIRDEAEPLYVRFRAPGTPERGRLPADGRTMGLEGIVSKRLGSRYRSGRSPDWLKFKNPQAPAVKREAEEGLG
jgi:hypothetical protein